VTPTGRRLETLALLQANPGISADRLVSRLGMTQRTARRDIAHLRELGYRIDAEPGRYGGYTLASGKTMPPLVLDGDEALAVALGLRITLGVEGLGLAAVTALAKITETVPARLRPRLAAIAAAAEAPAEATRRTVPGVLVALALACRASEAVSFRHRRGASGPGRPRDAQPHRLVNLRGRWYLIACERGSGQWRTYALDRVSEVRPLGTRLRVPSPPENASTFVAQALAQGPWQHRIRARLHTSGDLARQFIDPTIGDIRDDGESCILTWAPTTSIGQPAGSPTATSTSTSLAPRNSSTDFTHWAAGWPPVMPNGHPLMSGRMVSLTNRWLTPAAVAPNVADRSSRTLDEMN